VKPPTDVIRLAKHTHKSDEGVLHWADRSCSKEIHVFFLTLANLKLLSLIILV